MLLYRGTPEPECEPRPRDFPCIYFTPSFAVARDYAAGPAPGWIQEYRVRTVALLDFSSQEAKVLGRVFAEDPNLGGNDLNDVLWGLFLYPTEDWVQFLQGNGYRGTKTSIEWCIWNPELILTKQWRVEWRDGRWREEEIGPHCEDILGRAEKEL